MAIGQALLIVSTPLLTRLYTPEEFGLFSIFATLMAIGATMVALRYELAIPLEQDERAAAALTAAVCLISLLLSLVVCLLLWLWGPGFAAFLGAPELAPLLWLLAPCLMFWGAGSGLSFWLIRKDAFRLNGINRIVHFGTQAGGQVLLGPVGIGSAGLIVGYAAGYLARFLHLCVAIPQADLKAFCSSSFGEMRQVLQRYWRYPVFSASSSVLHQSCTMLPAVLIAMLYGPAMAGLYALAQRIVGLPLRLLGESANQVFLGEIRNLDHASTIRLFRRTTALFTGLGLAVLLPLAWAGPWLFTLLFGEAWRETSTIFQLLIPLYLSRFVVTPVAQTLNVLERQDMHLWAAGVNGLVLVLSFAGGWWLELGAYWTIGVFSVMSSMVFVFTIVIAHWILWRVDWQALRRREQPIEGLPIASLKSGM